MPHGPFPSTAGLPPPPPAAMVPVPCELYGYMVSALDLLNKLTYAPQERGEAFMGLVRAVYYCPSGGADAVGPPPSPTTAEVVNVTVDEAVVGTPNGPSTSQPSPPRASPSLRLEASLEVLKARRRVLARWPKAKKGPCPYLKEMSDECLLELDDELRALREEHLRHVAAGTVSSSSRPHPPDVEPHSFEESRSSPDVESVPSDSDKSLRDVDAHAQDATLRSGDDEALARDATSPPLRSGASKPEAVSPSHDKVHAQDASPAMEVKDNLSPGPFRTPHRGPLRSPGTLIEEAVQATKEAIHGISTLDVAGATCDLVSSASTSTPALESAGDAGYHASPPPSQILTPLFSSFDTSMENLGARSVSAAEVQGAGVSSLSSGGTSRCESEATPALDAEATVPSNTPKRIPHVFVGNLHHDVNEEKIRIFFRCYDACGIRSVKFLTERDTGRFIGCGLVEFSDPDTSLELAVSLNG